MGNTVNLALGLTNKVGEGLYFPFLDYDNLKKEQFDQLKEEINELISQFNLSTATIYSSHGGFHVYFFFDNRLIRETIINILKNAKQVDQKFKDVFEEFSQKGKGATLRLSGKHKKRDIYYFGEIKGRKPSYIEKSVGDSLKTLVEDQISNPIIDCGQYQYKIELDDNGKEQKEALPFKEENEVPVNTSNSHKDNNMVGLKKSDIAVKSVDLKPIEPTQPTESIQSPVELKASKKEVEKIPSEELFPENKNITKERELWYQGPIKKYVARLVSSSVEKREVAFIKNRGVATGLMILNNFHDYDSETGTFLYKDPQDGKIKTVSTIDENVKHHVLRMLKDRDFTKKLSIDGFIERRPFFMNNSIASNLMLKSYDYTTEKSGIINTPLHFFKSVYTLDTTNSVLSEKIKTSSMYNFNSDKDGKTSINNVQLFLNKNLWDLVEDFDIVYDFDSHDVNSVDSYENCRKMRDIFKSKNLPFSLNFSGSKGFHLKIPGRILKAHTPHLLEYIQKNFKKFSDKLLIFAKENNIHVDKGVYSGSARCLIRTEWSIHQATGSVVKPLTDKEFDSLQGKTLLQMQEMYKPSNLIKGNKALGVSKFNPQKKDVIVRIPMQDRYMSWEELRDAGVDEDEWKHVRDDIQNPISKELKALANEKETVKEFNQILSTGFYKWGEDDYMVEAPEYIDLSTGRNYDYCRQGNREALKEFVKEVFL